MSGATSPAPRRSGPVIAVTVLVGLLLTGCSAGVPEPGDGRRAGDYLTNHPPAEVASSAERQRRATAVAAAAVLHGWDRRRAAAYVAADAASLRALYAPAAAAGARDLRLLRRYAGRGWEVRSMSTQLLSVRVRRWEGDRLVLLVRDRLLLAVARLDSRRTLRPGDDVDRWRLALSRREGSWVMVAVTAR